MNLNSNRAKFSVLRKVGSAYPFPAVMVYWIKAGILLIAGICICGGLNTGVVVAQDMDFFEDTVQLSINDMQNDDRIIFLTDNWKVSSRDSMAFANPVYDDSHWENYSTQLSPSDLAFMDWEGIGWFRKKIVVDSSLVGVPLALIFTQHHGASEIFLNGEKIETIGKITTNELTTETKTVHWPQYIQFFRPGVHQLAVRYANFDAQVFNSLGFDAGFRLLLGDFFTHINETREEMVSSSSLKMLIVGSLIAFTVIHFLFFLFYPVEKNNLYFSLFTGFLALMTFSTYKTFFTDSPLWMISFFRVSLVTWLLTIIVALRFTYSLFYKKPPLQFWVLLVVGIILTLLTWVRHQWTDLYRELFVFLTLAEIFRVLITSFSEKRDGSWIISTGLSLFVGGIFYAIAVNMQLIEGDASTGNFVGSISLILGMSIYLSRNFAHTNKKLQHKLREVKHLSERSLKQERINKQKELERKLLEVENERKSRELEEARTLQLSMLPKNIPQSDFWDIAVYMETAYEVGGDYYDFSQSNNGILTVALGDATGHGMKAGIIVATAKSYFHTLADRDNTIDILRQMSHGIKNMNLKTMFMSFLLLKCNGRNIRMSVAGMPPALLFRKKEQTVEQVVIKGMPLGSRVDYPYEEIDLNLQTGDVLLIMSDGIVELFNEERKMLEIKRIQKIFKEAAALPVKDIIASLKREAEDWLDGKDPEDDITMVALKAR